MKTIYLECQMGAAGDMLLASLLELCDNQKQMTAAINAVLPKGVLLELEPAVTLRNPWDPRQGHSGRAGRGKSGRILPAFPRP